MNFYNEIDPFAASWLRELIKAGHIAPGVVDERSIEDVKPSELREFTQCHFFAGIGVWSYALRQAGWPDDRPVWTGSCPCQPFSAAGKRVGTADERHLWPAWFHLIEQRRPRVVFGEQVEAAIRQGWLDLVQADLEGIGYAFGASGLPAAGFGAPHIRQRLYFVANNNNTGLEGWGGMPERAGEFPARPCGVVKPGGQRRQRRQGSAQGCLPDGQITERAEGNNGTPRIDQVSFWSGAEWLYCSDEKYRPIEPGTFPLAHGATNRVGRLRGYGNAIVAPVAEAFIRAYLEREQ